jgi:ribosomal protein S6
MCIIHEQEVYIWVRGFVCVGESKQKANARVLEDVTSFLSNSTGSSNSSQQWGLKSLEETLVKNEITGYNEG